MYFSEPLEQLSLFTSTQSRGDCQIFTHTILHRSTCLYLRRYSQVQPPITTQPHSRPLSAPAATATATTHHTLICTHRHLNNQHHNVAHKFYNTCRHAHHRHSHRQCGSLPYNFCGWTRRGRGKGKGTVPRRHPCLLSSVHTRSWQNFGSW